MSGLLQIWVLMLVEKPLSLMLMGCGSRDPVRRFEELDALDHGQDRVLYQVSIMCSAKSHI